MPLGIRAIVDFVFKKIFGSPENSIALIGLLNAILKPERPIVAVEILNPFSYQEFAGAKQIILDVRAKDSVGRWFNIEMQVSTFAGLTQRLVYYSCSLYVDQLGKGDNYASLCSAISICLLNKKLFLDTPQPHHCFQMIDRSSGRALDNAIEIHTLELKKYNLDEITISQANKLDQWVFLLLRAQEYDAARLRQLLPGIEFDQAIGVIETIASKTEDRQMYDQREKALRDHEWALSSARQEGREEGRQEGRQEGREEGRQEGVINGKIQLIQELLGEEVTPIAQLETRPLAELESVLAALKARLRNRQS